MRLQQQYLAWLWVGLAMAIASSAQVGAAAPASSPASQPAIQAVVYAPATQATVKESLDVVIELRNRGTTAQRVSDNYGLERIVPPEPNAAPIAERRAQRPAASGVLRVVLQCKVPRGSQLRHVAREGPFIEAVRVIEGGESLLMKVRLPPNCLATGECWLSAEVYDGPTEVARSGAFVVRGVE